VLSFIWSGFVSTALPLFGGEVVGISTSTLGLVFTAGLLVDLILLLPIGWLSDRLEGRVVLTPALLLMAGALAYLPQATSLGGLFVVSICLHTGVAHCRTWHTYCTSGRTGSTGRTTVMDL